jgi:hypothetical protein
MGGARGFKLMSSFGSGAFSSGPFGGAGVPTPPPHGFMPNPPSAPTANQNASTALPQSQLTRRLDANHDMTFGAGLANFAVAAEATAQNVRTRLQVIQGEWFLDVSAGVPYLDNDYVSKAITDKPADLAFAESSIQEEILDTEGVLSLVSFASQFNRSTRLFNVQAVVETEYGTTENIKVIYE